MPIFQTYSPNKLPKAASENYFPKLLPKATPQNYALKLISKISSKLPYKAAPQTYSTKLFPKPLPKIIIESCSEQLLPQAAKSAPQIVSESYLRPGVDDES